MGKYQIFLALSLAFFPVSGFAKAELKVDDQGLAINHVACGFEGDTKATASNLAIDIGDPNSKGGYARIFLANYKTVAENQPAGTLSFPINDSSAGRLTFTNAANQEY
ncbi:hypothetical protein K2X33_03100, partial [bacterium]|nr:hypothetical protein [bacterium]